MRPLGKTSRDGSRRDAQRRQAVRREARRLRLLFGMGHDVARPPDWVAPVVFASPHSGALYPAEFTRASVLAPADLRRNEDAHVDRLWRGAVEAGAPLLRALFPRCYIDANRAGDDLPPEWRDAPWGGERGGERGRAAEAMTGGPSAPNRLAPSGAYRSNVGLGVVPLVMGEAQPIYRTPPARLHVHARLDALYWPYHRALGSLLDAAQARWGRAVLVDCHSMPGAVGRKGTCPADVVLGDGHGRTAHADTVDTLEALFAREGYTVRRNSPYAGGYSTLHYGDPARGVEAVQIEINRDLYLRRDSRGRPTLEPSAEFPALQAALARVARGFVEAQSRRGGQGLLAAE